MITRKLHKLFIHKVENMKNATLAYFEKSTITVQLVKYVCTVLTDNFPCMYVCHVTSSEVSYRHFTVGGMIKEKFDSKILKT